MNIPGGEPDAPTGEGEDDIGDREGEEWSGCVVKDGDPHRWMYDGRHSPSV